MRLLLKGLRSAVAVTALPVCPVALATVPSGGLAQGWGLSGQGRVATRTWRGLDPGFGFVGHKDARNINSFRYI